LFRNIIATPEHANTLAIFLQFQGLLAVEPITAAAAVGIHIEQGRGLDGQIGENAGQHQVLEEIGMVAGVESVLVTEQGVFLLWRQG